VSEVKRYNWTDPPQVFLADTFVAASDYDALLAQHTRLKEAGDAMAQEVAYIATVNAAGGWWAWIPKQAALIVAAYRAAAQQTPDGQEKV
jgi:hypothetical protein